MGYFSLPHDIRSFFNQLNHPKLVPCDLNSVRIRSPGLLAHTVSACSDNSSQCILMSIGFLTLHTERKEACQVPLRQRVAVPNPRNYEPDRSPAHSLQVSSQLYPAPARSSTSVLLFSTLLEKLLT
jgi:hypothetical protein